MSGGEEIEREDICPSDGFFDWARTEMVYESRCSFRTLTHMDVCRQTRCQSSKGTCGVEG